MVEASEYSKAYTYSQRATCLKDFQRIFESANNPQIDDHDRMAAVYRYYLDMAGDALRSMKNGSAIRDLEVLEYVL